MAPPTPTAAAPLARLAGAASRWWVVVGLILLWQLWVTLAQLNSVVMPSPWAVAAGIVRQPGLFLGAAAQTLAMALLGLCLGMAVGCGLAVLTWISSILSGLLTPIALVFASVPVVGIVPILARLFGYGTGTVLAIVTIICFFPAFVFTSSGLRALPVGSADLFGVLGAGTWARLRMLALPAALPDIAIALRVGAAHSILAAMVAEFLMGVNGLGHLFEAARSTLDMTQAMGASAIAAVISILAFVLATMAESRVRAGWR
ncbi:MAG: ABC transporter permease subunit [Xenophilus sp.]